MSYEDVQVYSKQKWILGFNSFYLTVKRQTCHLKTLNNPHTEKIQTLKHSNILPIKSAKE